MEQGLIRPNAGWSPMMAARFCRQESLRMSTFARWIWLILNNTVTMAMLGQSTLEWRNRCISQNSFPLPLAEYVVTDGYTTNHAVATLLALTDNKELLDAFPLDGDMPPHMYHVLNCILSAMVAYVEELEGLRLLSQGIVLKTLKHQPETRLIMPPALALCIPGGELTMDQVLNLLCQTHHFIVNHRTVNYYWIKSILGYMILLLQSSHLDIMAAIQRLTHDFKQSNVMRGMMLTQALDQDIFTPNVTETKESPVVVRLHVQLVFLLLCLTDNSPMGCVTEAIEWITRHPLGIQMARAKDTRPMVRQALSRCKSCLEHLPLLQHMDALRFMVRTSRHLPISVDCILDEDVRYWTEDGMEMICNDGRLVDVVVWRCMFQSGAPVSVVRKLLGDIRFRHRDWQVPLRMHYRIPDPRRPPRMCGPLVRVVSSEPMVAADLGEAVMQIALQPLPDSHTMGARWWRSATRNDPEGYGLPYVMKGWLLRRLRLFAQSMDVGSPGTFPAHVEDDILTILRGHPDTLTVANCIWFMIQFCTDNTLALGVSTWIQAHSCSWVSVIRDGVVNLASVIPQLQHRCLQSPDVFSATSAVFLVLWTNMSGSGQQSMGPPIEFLSRCDMLAILGSMSSFQCDLFLTSSIDKMHYSLWATIRLSSSTTLSTWACTVADMYGFGPLSDIVNHLIRAETLSIPTTVLETVVATLKTLLHTSHRIQGYEVDDTSDLSQLVKGLVRLLQKEYETFRPSWEIMIAWHPGHMVDIPGVYIAGLLQRVVSNTEWRNDAVCMTKFMTKWIQAMGAGASPEWKADVDMYDMELASLYSTTHKACRDTALCLLNVLQEKELVRDDSLLALTVRLTVSS